MSVDVTVDPDVTLFILSERLEELLREVHLWVKLKVRVDPLAIQINSCN